MLPDGERDVLMANDFIHLAAAYADASAAWGMVNPGVLCIARWLTQVGERDGVNVCETERYKGYQHLWRAWDVRMAQMDEETQAGGEAGAGAHCVRVRGAGVRDNGEAEEGATKVCGKVPNRAQAPLLWQELPAQGARVSLSFVRMVKQ